MGREKIRYLIAKPGRDGTTRWYWQMPKDLRRQGWQSVNLGREEIAAREKARQLNEQLDGWQRRRRDGRSWRKVRPEIAGVYVIGTERGPVKVGFATNPFERLVAVQVGSHVRLKLFFFWADPVVAAPLIEAAAHRALAAKALEGEWFRVSPIEAAGVIVRVATELHAQHNRRQYAEQNGTPVGQLSILSNRTPEHDR